MIEKYDENGILLEEYRINVGQLKKLIKDIPDDYLVCIFDHDYMSDRHYILSQEILIKELVDKPFIVIR